MTAIFDDPDSKTRLSFGMLFDSAGECDKVKLYAVDANEQNFDRLKTELSKLSRTV